MLEQYFPSTVQKIEMAMDKIENDEYNLFYGQGDTCKRPSFSVFLCSNSDKIFTRHPYMELENLNYFYLYNILLNV
jgi:hypothetical protein